MKRFLLLLLCLPTLAPAQDSLLHGIMPMRGGRVLYEKVVDMKGNSKHDIFLKIKDWSTAYYSDAPARLQSEDKDLGYIVFKSYSLNNESPNPLKSSYMRTTYLLKFYIKDEKVKVVASDFEVIDPIVRTGIIIELHPELQVKTVKKNKKEEALQQSLTTIKAAHSDVEELLNRITKALSKAAEEKDW